mmetsp:Transcript_59005/g.172735  ORF Transcript_59005/g.172735 Transcript_59005/m.172735 type:complete len:385 (-) Transcript_59005:276-1430(-)
MAVPVLESHKAVAEFVVVLMAKHGWSKLDACKVTEMHGGSTWVYLVESSEPDASLTKVVFKRYANDPLRNLRMLDANSAFSKVGSTQPHIAASDNWCIEPFSDPALYHIFDPATEEVQAQWLGRIAKLAALIDTAPADWFESVRAGLQRLHPCLVGVPKGSPIWPCVAYNDPSRPGERACADLDKFTLAQIQQLTAALPSPFSEAGRSVVSTHGDLHPGNIVFVASSDELKAMDLEFACVSNALQDLIYLPERSKGTGRRAFSAAYLQARNLSSTEVDVEIFAFDVIVATLVHYGILRPLLMEWYGENIEMDEALALLGKLNAALLAIQADLQSHLANDQHISSSACAHIIDNLLDVRGMFIDEFVQMSPVLEPQSKRVKLVQG